MKELSTETNSNMHPATGLEKDTHFRNDFYFHRELPENLEFLDTLSWNYYWCWNPEGVRLFRELEPSLWEQCEQNPRLLLKKISGLRLWQKANDSDYVKRLQCFSGNCRKPATGGNRTLKNPSRTPRPKVRQKQPDFWLLKRYYFFEMKTNPLKSRKNTFPFVLRFLPHKR